MEQKIQIPKDFLKVNKSDIIDGIHYNEQDKTLSIRFTQGDVYQYQNVPSDAANAFKNAKSLGSFFHKNIKNKFKTRKLP